MSRYAVGIDLGGTKVEACLVDGTREITRPPNTRPSEPGLGRERVVSNILELVAETAGGSPSRPSAWARPAPTAPRRTSCTAPPTRRFTRSRDSSASSVPSSPCRSSSRTTPTASRSRSSSPSATGASRRSWPSSWARAWARGSFSGTGSTAVPTGTPARSGHTSIAVDGRLCECGRKGCGEAYLSGPSLGRRYAELAGAPLLPKRSSSASKRATLTPGVSSRSPSASWASSSPTASTPSTSRPSSSAAASSTFRCGTTRSRRL